MGGQHLTWENRIAIESLLKAKVSAAKIAEVVGCSKRTVYREIQRGLCEQLNGTTYEMYTIYSAQKAQNRADKMNDLHKGRPVKLCPELAVYLEDYIGTRHYSPAAATREILLQGLALPQISANTVYRYIYRGYLRLCGLDLPVGRYNVKQKQEQRSAKSHRNDRSIDDRPSEVETREDVGFWEMDTVVGKSAGASRCLLVLTERKTRFEIVRVLKSKTTREVLRVLKELRQEFGEDFRKLFKEFTGISPALYQQELRLQRARELLSSTPISIKEIAYRLNFDSPDYFSSKFKAKVGCKPSEYREKMG